MAIDAEELLAWYDAHPCAIDPDCIDGERGTKMVWRVYANSVLLFDRTYDRLADAIEAAMEAEREEGQS